MIERPVLTDIEVRMQGFDAYDVAPEKVPDLLAERPLLLFGKYKGDRRVRSQSLAATAEGNSATVSISVRPTRAGETRPCVHCGRASGSRFWKTSCTWAEARRSKPRSPVSA